MARRLVDLWLKRARLLYEEGQGFASLKQALKGLAAEQAAWSPKGFNSIWQIVNHVAFWKDVDARRLQGEMIRGREIDNEATFGDRGDPSDDIGWQAALQRLEDAHRRFVQALDRLTDQDLVRPVSGGSYTLGDLVAGLIEHDAYHGGQIVALRRLQGSWPPA